jgi:WD40 repeat protein
MKPSLFKKYWLMGPLGLGCLFILSCNLLTPGGSPTLTPSLTPQSITLTPTIKLTSTPISQHPCPQATQELPPRVAPLTSPTDQLTQVVQIFPGNYQTAVIEMETGTFTAEFKGGEGAKVEVTLLPNTVHHLKLTVKVRQSQNNGCSYGGYTMTVFQDVDKKPLEIIQGTPSTPAPVQETFGPKTFLRLKRLAQVSLPDKLQAWGAIFDPQNILLSYGFGQGVYFWQPPQAAPAGELFANKAWMTTSAALSFDGALLATGSGGFETTDENQTSVRLWDMKTKQSRVLGHHTSVVECLAFSPDGRLLASGGNDNTVLIWDVLTGHQVAKFEGDLIQHADGSSLIQGMRQLFWMDDATVLARADAVVYAWKVPTGERVLELKGEYQYIDYFRPRGLLALVQPDGVFLRDPTNGDLSLLPDSGENSRGYLQVALSPDGSLLAALNPQKITFWDTATKRSVVSGNNPAGAPLVFSPDWHYLARVDWDAHSLGLWGVQP